MKIIGGEIVPLRPPSQFYACTIIIELSQVMFSFVCKNKCFEI